MPRVSVIIPCYNYAHFLPEAVESVVSQTFRDFEIIIVDDGSPDNTSEVAAGLTEKYPAVPVRLIRQVNAGLPGARNNGIRAARGGYILPLDADDMLRPGHIEALANVLDGDASICLAYTWSEKFGTESELLKHGEFTLRNLLVRDGPPQSPMFRKSAWERVGGYSPVMKKGGEDWEFSCSLYEAGCKGVVVPEPLFLYRRHGPSMIDDMVKNHALTSSRDIKLLHPRMFEPGISRLSVGLARAVIWLKYYTRDRVARYFYVRHPRFHRLLSDMKYSLLFRR